AWSSRGSLEPFRDRLIQGMERNGYEPEFAESLYRQLQGFGEYGFPESHSASFAKLAWFSAWLKCHEPAAFLVSLLNSQPMGFYGSSQLVQDARRHGVRVLPVDVQHSDIESTLEFPEPDCGSGSVKFTSLESGTSEYEKSGSGASSPVRLGLHSIRHLPSAAAKRIVNARQKSG